MPRLEAVAMGLATLALAAAPARAQQPPAADKEQAAKLAADAEAAGKKQQFADALAKYKEAAKLDPANAAYQCNIGMAYYALGDEARAHIYFGRCFKANGGWPANVEAVFNYVVDVLGKEDFTPLKFSGTPGNAEVLINLYAEEGPLATPVTVYVPYANYQIQVRAEGYETRTIPVEAKSRNEKEIDFQLLPSGAGRGEPGAEPSGANPPDGDLVGSGGDVSKDVETGGRKKWPLLIAGGGAVAVIGGVFAFRAAQAKQDELCSIDITEDGKCTGNVRPDQQGVADRLESEMRTREILSYSLLGVGAAAIGAGLILYFMQPESSGSVAVSANPVAGGGIVTLSLSR